MLIHPQSSICQAQSRPIPSDTWPGNQAGKRSCQGSRDKEANYTEKFMSQVLQSCHSRSDIRGCFDGIPGSFIFHTLTSFKSEKCMIFGSVQGCLQSFMLSEFWPSLLEQPLNCVLIIKYQMVV